MGKRKTSIDHRPSATAHFGLLNIFKPAGLTSREAVDRVQRLVRPAKAGHAGTLDPLATGVLIVCVGKATRLVPLIHEMHKVYRASFLLGRTSQTDDTEGIVVEHPDPPRPTREQIIATLPEFVGRIEQRPPVYSAVRVGGRRAYKLARQGHDVEVAPRPVDVHRIDLAAYAYPELVLEIECGTGTYIRSIGRDLGDSLRCGAVMSALERTAIGPFTVDSAVPVEGVTRESLSEFLLPPTASVPELPQLVVNATDAAALTNGRSVALNHVDTSGGRGSCPAANAETAVLNESGVLIAFAVIDGDRLSPKMVFASQD